MIELRGSQYYLKTLSPEDVSLRYLAWLSDPEVNRFLEVRHQEHTLDSLRAYVAQYNNERKYLFGIYTVADDEHIGTASIYDISPYYHTANYGYLVGEKMYWGKGVVIEAISLLFDFAFFQLGIRKITTHGYIENIATVINYKKLGMMQEGRLKKHAKLDDRYIDCVIYSLFKEDWERKRDRG